MERGYLEHTCGRDSVNNEAKQKSMERRKCNKQILLSVCILMAVLLTGCSRHNESYISEKRTESSETSPVMTGDVSDEHYAPYVENKEELFNEINESWEMDSENFWWIKSGTMSVECTRVRVIDNIHDLETVNEHSFCSCTVFKYENGNQIVWKYPDCFMSDGTFEADGRLILVDLKINNIDAISTKAVRENLEDIYLFHVNFMFEIIDNGELNLMTEEYGETSYPVYFDHGGEFSEEQIFRYQFPPGETREITIGFLVSGRRDGTTVKLSEVEGIVRGTYKTVTIPFGLKDE